jgi:spermidine synthase
VWIFAAGSGRRPRRRGAMIAAAFAMACVALATRVDFNRELLTSGIFRARRLFPLGTNKILFYRDGRTATVSGTYASPATIMLATNGKVDASLDDAWLRPPSLGARPRTFTADASTQALLAVLALAHEPRARTAAVVGQGSGMTSHLLLGSSQLRSLTTLEIEPQMIEGSNVFYPANRRVFEDPRSHFVIEDARSYLAASPNRYDLIISEPSNPWVSGVASLFTTEFYRIASSRLAPGGALAQWIQLYEINDDLLLSILAAIHANFRSYTLYQASVMDLVVVATNDSTLPPPDWSVVRWPTLAADLHNFIPLTPQSLDALWMADRDVFAPLIEHGIEPNSDEHPVLDLEAERERYLNHSAREFVMLGTHRFDPFAALRHHKFAPATEQETTTPEIARAQMQALAARLRVGLDAAHDTLPPVRDYPPMLMRKRMLEAFIAHGAPPPDWQLWMRTVAIVEKDVQGAASGVADESFYAPIYSFMRANNAPVRAFAALDFMHGLASWNFQQASTAADILMPDADLGEGWVPNDMFRDGTVVAKLETGDVAGARKAFETLTPLVGSRSDLRSRLLAAQIR